MLAHRAESQVKFTLIAANVTIPERLIGADKNTLAGAQVEFRAVVMRPAFG